MLRNQVNMLQKARIRSNHWTPRDVNSIRSFEVAPSVHRLRCDKSTSTELGTTVYARALRACRVCAFERADSIKHTWLRSSLAVARICLSNPSVGLGKYPNSLIRTWSPQVVSQTFSSWQHPGRHETFFVAMDWCIRRRPCDIVYSVD